MSFTILSNVQLIIITALMALISAVLVSVNMWWLDSRLLPHVHQDAAGVCIKVVNFENGHAFNCQDVNILLRRYHVVTD